MKKIKTDKRVQSATGILGRFVCAVVVVAVGFFAFYHDTITTGSPDFRRIPAEGNVPITKSPSPATST